MPDDLPWRPVADNFARRFAPQELYDPKKRREWKLGKHDGDRGPYVIELNFQHIEGLSGAIAAFETRLAALNGDPALAPPRPDYISKTYARCMLTVDEWQRLLVADGEWAAKEAQDAHNSLGSPPSGPIDSMRYRAIYMLWPDFPVQSQIYRSVATVKADAAFKSFGAAGAGIVWAVIDSGIDDKHQHFDIASGHTLLSSEVRDLHRCFVDSESTFAGIPVLAPAPMNPDGLERPSAGASQEMRDEYLKKRKALIEEHRRLALTDDFGHGTHVAGIIAGMGKPGTTIRLLERVEEVTVKGELERGQFKQTGTLPGEQVRGMAPNCRLISLRVLDGNGEGRSSDVIRALDYVRERLNDNPKLQRVQGVNLSVGYEFDPEMFASGESPICAQVNRLVQSGVVVVAAAGNTGFGTVAASVRPTKVGLSNTINDPGNAELAITVGATHRDSPHNYGVSYFSSKGPTGDGRIKPDLVAPGERITSCGAGKRLKKATESAGLSANDGRAYYMEDSGTSMAAAHVSGAAAALLSVRRDLIGQPEAVKAMLMDSAVDLRGRDRNHQGRGLLDLMQALQQRYSGKPVMAKEELATPAAPPGGTPLGEPAAPTSYAPVPVVPPELPPALITACSEGQCVLFVGAGIGAQAGCPTWREALERLIDFAASNDSPERWSDLRRALDAGQVMLVAELLATRCERSVLVDELRKLYPPLGGNLPRVWRALATVPFANVLTSTWDALVDRAFEIRKQGQLVVVTPWSTEEELRQLLSAHAFCIARLWGDLTTGRIIFTDDEYREALKENPLWARYLTTLALSRPHFFVGTSLATVEHYISNLLTRDQSVRHYALVPDGEGMQLQRERFSRYGVELILFTPTTGWPEVTAAAEALSTAVRRQLPLGPKPALETVTLSEMTLRNIGPFEEFSLKFSPGWNVILGNNGLGKSTLLKAMALGLCGDDVNAAVDGGRLLRRKGGNQDKGSIQLQAGRESYRTDIANEAGSLRVTCDQVTPLQHGRWLVLGFPPLRGLSTQDPSGMTQGGSPTPTVHDLLPLLAGPADIRLNNLKQWLVNLDICSTPSQSVTPEEAARNQRLRNKFFEVLAKFTPGVRVSFHSVTGGKVLVETDDGIVSMDQLSQGVGSIIGWLGTLLQRMYEIYGDSAAPEEGTAIVLIDEVDAHLHPQWQQILVDAVKGVFPATQFIVTTHSPLIVAGLTRDEVMILRRDSSPQRRIEVTRPPTDLKGWRVDQILTGEAFGLGGARDLKTVANLDRYTELMGKYPRSLEEEEELRALAGKLETDLPPPESQKRARKAYEIIASAVKDKLDAVPEDERRRLNAEIKTQVQEIVTGERRRS